MGGIAIAPDAVATVDGDADIRRAILAAASSFAVFLRWWVFIDQESGKVRRLGSVLWPGQRLAVEAFTVHDCIFELKARKLGLSTLEIAWDAWCARFRYENARVHLFSRRDDAAIELLAAVKYGLERLPEWMRLPIIDANDHELTLVAGPDDRRLVKSYPASPNTAVEATCNHAHVDELDRMPFAEKTWQAIEPSFAGSVHVVTTVNGPATFGAKLWRRTASLDTNYHPLFVDALQRPDRDRAWWEKRVRGFGETETRREYPLRAEDALFGGGDFVFDGKFLDEAVEYPVGSEGPKPGFTYVSAWDIGRHKDASAVVELRVAPDSDEVHVIHYERHRNETYPTIQTRVKYLHELYGGITAIEANNAGEAVAENVDLPEGSLDLFNTTVKSKARIIAQLQLAFQNGHLYYDAAAWPQLDAELRAYQWDDKALTQDSVMALAIAYEHVGIAAAAPRRARVARVIRA